MKEKRIPTWPILLLLLPAFVAIWGGWVGLGEKTGFGLINLLPGMGNDTLEALDGVKGYNWAVINTAITLPIGLETYAAYALHVFLHAVKKGPLRTFAGWSALASLVLGGGGQIAYHIMEAREIERAPIWVTAVVGSLPVLVLGMGFTLAALVKRAEHASGDDVPTQTLAERVKGLRSQVSDVVEAMKVPTPPRGTDIGATPVPYLAEIPLGPDTAPEPAKVPSPRPSIERIPRLRGQWDVHKAVRMILDEATDAEVSAAVGVGVKSVQRARVAVKLLRADPHAIIPPSYKVPDVVVGVVREEVRKL